MPANSNVYADSAVQRWHKPPANLELSADEVHVWRASLNQPHLTLRYLDGILASEERKRAARFYFERDRNHFIASRGLLRDILGRYLNLPPGRLQIKYSSYGKPFLADDCGGEWLRFNVSHSGELALYAFSRGRELGIDIEEIRTDVAHQQIASDFFSKQEVDALHAHSGAFATGSFLPLLDAQGSLHQRDRRRAFVPSAQFRCFAYARRTRLFVSRPGPRGRGCALDSAGFRAGSELSCHAGRGGPWVAVEMLSLDD